MRNSTDESHRYDHRFFQALLEHASDIITIVDVEGSILYASPSVERVLGYSPEELIGTHSFALVHPDDVQNVQEAFARRLEDGDVVQITQYRYRHRDGSWRVLESTGRSRLDDPTVRGVVVNSRDVTEQKQAREALERSESYYRSLFENAADVVSVLNADGSIRYESPSIERVLGWGPEELYGRNVFEFIHPDDVAQVMATFEQILRSPGSVERYDLRFRHKDGSWRVLDGLGRNLLHDPAVGGVVANSRDVTERRAAEEKLRRSEAQTYALLSAQPDLMFHIRADGQFLAFHAPDDASLAIPRENVVGSRVAEIFPPEMANRMLSLLGSALETQEVQRWEYPLPLEGEIRHYEARVVPAGVDEVLAIVRDTTEMKRAEQALVRAKEGAEAANRAKSDFLSSMSHELRTPLNSVIGFANVLRKNKNGNLREQDQSYLERILANGKHLLTLINDILDLSKIEAGKMELHLAPASLTNLVVEVLDQLRGAVAGKNVELRAAVPEDLALLDTDEGKLKQVLINLVGNGIKFTEQGSVTVSVGVDPETGHPVRVDVRDTGMGIAPERLSPIFHSFEQGESGTARRFGGSGLGLAISRSLTELMGYRLEVTSSVGAGSTFSILLAPVQTEGSASAWTAPQRAVAPRDGVAAEDDETRDHGGKLVLVIDDETDARMLLTHHLEELGCQTITASTGEQGLRMAREFRPKLITLDLFLPGITGWDILRMLKADPALCDIPVVIVSVVAEENRGAVFGAVDLLEKPVDQSKLHTILQRHLQPKSGGRVLVVDDDADTRDLLGAYLHEEEVEIRTAANGREALQVLEGFTPDLIVLDLLMPELDGIGLLRVLHENAAYRHVPVVVVTAKDLSPEEVRNLSRETLAVLRKDAELESDLRAVIQQICMRREQVGSTGSANLTGPSEVSG